MKLHHKIKSYFLKQGFHTWKDFSWDDYVVSFDFPDDGPLVELTGYIKSNVSDSDQPGNSRYRLKVESAKVFDSLDQLIVWLQEIILEDFQETSAQSLTDGFDFKYFVAKHAGCQDTVCLSNGLNLKHRNDSNCVYTLASIRKFKGKYYGWSAFGQS